MALAIVCTEARGSKRPLCRYAGTTSFTFVAATNFAIGSPARFAISPAVRFPKLPLGVQTWISAPGRTFIEFPRVDRTIPLPAA